jgi:ankyrin repeat protein
MINISEAKKQMDQDYRSGKIVLDKPYFNGNTMLHMLMRIYKCNSSGTLTAHLTKTIGPHIDIQNDFGQTPLWFACEKGREDNVEFLLNLGANPCIPDKMGSIPIILACQTSHACFMEIYKRRPELVNYIRLRDGASLWHCMAWKGGLETLRFLCETSGIAVPIDQLLTDRPQSALAIAVEKERKDMALELMQAGAQLTVAMRGLKTVPEWAIIMALNMKDRRIHNLTKEVTVLADALFESQNHHQEQRKRPRMEEEQEKE